jgi:MFS family permease
MGPAGKHAPPATRRSRTLGWLLAILGLGMAVASLLADLITGAAAWSIGWRQLLGCLVGLGLLGVGILLAFAWPARQARALRWAVAAYIAAASFALSLFEPVSAASWILFGYAAAACLLLPPRLGILSLAGLVGLDLSLSWISAVKADLTGMPLTMLDLRIAVANPAGLWEALDLPQWSRRVALAVVLLVLLWWAWTCVTHAARFLGRRPRGAVALDAVARTVLVGVLAGMSWLYLQQLYAALGEESSTWHHERVVRLADRIGTLPFVAYSYHIEASTAGDIYRRHPGATPPGREELDAAIGQYVGFRQVENPGPGIPPNVVMVLAESTFDLSRIFHLRGDWNTALFRANELTAALGPLRVNTKGGGTWITEFETIVGLDARLFGYSGAYTHASLSPFVERSLASYMEGHGYRTAAFLANTGDFYNSRRAYESYGFQQVYDSQDLGAEGGWFEDDVDVVESVQATLGPSPAAPFFAYVMLIENHGPHECTLPEDARFELRFAGDADFEANCILQEYLRRLDSTTAAVAALVEYLADIETRTGRPFVLLVFGDHQPLTFTGYGKVLTDFGPFRKSPDMYETFYHLMSSAPTWLDCCSEALPAAALPTLVSALVASGPDDLYLGENLWLFAHCGSDAIGRDFADRMSSLRTSGAGPRIPGCEAAYRRALAGYRAAGIMRLDRSPAPDR